MPRATDTVAISGPRRQEDARKERLAMVKRITGDITTNLYQNECIISTSPYVLFQERMMRVTTTGKSTAGYAIDSIIM